MKRKETDLPNLHTKKNKRMPLKKSSVDSCETCVLDLVLHCPNWCVKMALCAPTFWRANLTLVQNLFETYQSKTFTLRNQHLKLIIKKKQLAQSQQTHTILYESSPSPGDGRKSFTPVARGCAAKEQKRLISSLVEEVVEAIEKSTYSPKLWFNGDLP